MDLALRYATRLSVAAAALTSFLMATGFGGADAPWTLWARLPGLAGFALILACFPAGLAVGASVLRSPAAFVREGLALTGIALGVVAVVFVVVQYVAPNALAAGRLPGEGATVEVRELTLPALREYGREVIGRAEAGPRSDLEAWTTANLAAFEHERRLAHSSLPFFLTWLGALAGFWAGRLRHAQLRVLQLTAMGLFLLISMYLGGENGYELVAARMAGQAYFAAWFIPLAPAILGLGLGWPTLIMVFTGTEEENGL